MALIESVRNYIAECPLLVDNNINIDYLGALTGSISVEEVPTQAVVETMINGDLVCQFDFIIASRFLFSEEVDMAIANSQFWDDLEEWIREQNNAGNLPILDKGVATDLQVVTSGYLFGISSGMRDARYQIQLKMIYEIEV